MGGAAGASTAFIMAAEDRAFNMVAEPRVPIPGFGRAARERMAVWGLKMNKNDLVANVATSTGLSKADATKAVDGVFEAITSTLKDGSEVRLVGFGTFSVSARAATTGRNPRTGESIQIPASNQPKFKAGKGLKAAVN